MANNTCLYEIQVELEGVKPRVWRRVLVPESTTLADLDQIIQIAMGWQNKHAHIFDVNGKQYSSSELEDVIPTPVGIDRAFSSAPNGFGYTYDIGDDWKHTVRLIGKHPFEDSIPTCLGGAGACPPEDVGGVAGYTDFLRAIADPKDREHDHWVTWVGGSFDPDCFNVTQATDGLIAWGIDSPFRSVNVAMSMPPNHSMNPSMDQLRASLACTIETHRT